MKFKAFTQYGGDATVEDVDYEYSEAEFQVPELKQPSQTIATIVPAPTSHKEDHKCELNRVFIFSIDCPSCKKVHSIQCVPSS